MKKYELVVIINPSLAKDEQNSVIESIESILPNGYEQKDDMWVQKVFNFEPAGKNKSAYYISYLIEIDSKDITEMKKKLWFVKWLYRYVFFSITNKSVFVNYSEINQRFSEIVKKEPKKSSRDRKNEIKKEVIDENEVKNEESAEAEKPVDNVDVIPEYEEPKKRVAKKKAE